MASYTLTHARVIGFEGLQYLQVTDGQIEAIAPMASFPGPKSGPNQPGLIADMGGDWISLGGVDLQINGALGQAFPDLRPGDEATLTKIAQFLWHQGIDAFLPTLVTTATEKFHQALAVLQSFQLRSVQQVSRHQEAVTQEAVTQEAVTQEAVTQEAVTQEAVTQKPATQEPVTQKAVVPHGSGAQTMAAILGAHLEGPWLNPTKRGAHPAAHLQPLSIDDLQTVLADYGDIVRLITLAPELDQTHTTLPYLTALGITVSLGHSLATAEQAQHAFAQGASMVTHAFNAMPGLHHREPGLLGAAIAHPQVFCGLIADGQHVCPTMLEIFLRAGRGRQAQSNAQTNAQTNARPNAQTNAQMGANPCDGIFLVSDALAPLGLPDGIYPWDSRQIQVNNGTARLPDGTLSGTTRPLLDGVKNLVAWGLCELPEAIALATETPRLAIGLPGIGVGQPATLLRWRQTQGAVTWQRISFHDEKNRQSLKT